jgi:hypothetical protein
VIDVGYKKDYVLLSLGYPYELWNYNPWNCYINKYNSLPYHIRPHYSYDKVNIYNNIESLKLIRVPRVRRVSGADGKGIKVAVINSGVNIHDPFLRDKIADSYNFLQPKEDISLNSEHGTLVTKVILDVAPGTTILAYKVSEEGKTPNPSHFISAIHRAIFQGAQIINLSSSVSWLNFLTYSAEEAVKRGIIVITAAGNNYENWHMEPPGNSPYVITVGATNKDGSNVAPYSNRGPIPDTWEIKPDVVAPGKYSDDTNVYYGTSFAAPYVTGSAALIKQKHPSWGPNEIKSALATTAHPLMDNSVIISPISQGSGRIDVFEAINTNLIFYPIHISFEPVETQSGVNTQMKSLNIRNVGITNEEYGVTFLWDHTHEGLTDELNLSVITLQPGEEKQILLSLTTQTTTKSGLYSGNIFITSNEPSEKMWRIPILALVEPLDYPLLRGISVKIELNTIAIKFIVIFFEQLVEVEIINPNQKTIFKEDKIYHPQEVITTLNFTYPLEKGTYKFILNVTKSGKYPRKKVYEFNYDLK